MISEHKQARINNTERSKESYAYQYEKRNNIQRQEQANKQYLFRQVKCMLKQRNGDYKIFLTIYFKGPEGHIIYKRRDQNKQSHEASCSSIVKILEDSAKISKIMLKFNQKINCFDNKKDDCLEITFDNDQMALKCRSELYRYIKNDKCEVKQRAVLKTQYHKSEKIAQDIPLLKKQMSMQSQKLIKRSIRTQNNQQMDQKQATYRTKEILTKQSQDLYKKIEQIEKQLSKTRRELQEQREENQKMRQNQRELQKKGEENKRMRQNQAEINQKDSIIRLLNRKIKNLEQQMNKKEKEHKQQIAEMENKIKRLQTTIKQTQQVLKDEKEQNNRLKAIIEQKQLDMQQKKAQAIKLIDNELTELRRKHQTEIAELELKNKKRYEEQIKKFKSQTQNLGNRKYKDIQSNYQQVQKNYLNLLQKYQVLQKDSNEMKYLHIFEGPVLQNYIEHKQFLKESIEKYTRRRILKTTLIYKFEKKGNVNFHNYIDGYQNFIVIAKTSSAMFFAGFSQSCIKSGYIANKGGLILSLTNQRAFELNKNMRSVSYDDYFIIFGNSQIRIRWQECKVFSNFGTSNGYYNAQGESINILLGQGTVRETFLENYEFHQVIFEY